MLEIANQPINISNELLDKIESEACKESLFEFVKSFWSEIIPEEPVYNWHIPYLCEELQIISEWIFNRQKKEYDLIINIPPGTTKSTIITIMFPAWLWAVDPTIRVISNSYAADLALDHSVKSRDIITSEKYIRLFPETRIRPDKSAKGAYENTSKGARYSTSTGSAITGKHAHIIINDDPLNPKQASSDADRKQAIEHTKTLSSRKVNKKNTPTITIMQRLHEQDVTGYLLSKKGDTIKHICLPAELSDSVKPVDLKQRYIDDLLDPIRLDSEVLKEAKKDLGSYGYANQFEQETAPPEGGIFKKDWFPIIQWKPEYESLIWNFAVDTAYTEKLDNDESAFIAYAHHKNDLIIRHVNECWLELPELVKHSISYSSLHGFSRNSRMYVEPKASGKSLVQTLGTDHAFNAVEDKTPLKDKVARAQGASPPCEAKRVKLIEGNWNKDFLDRLTAFPNNKHKGLVDCLSIAVDKMPSSIKQNHKAEVW